MKQFTQTLLKYWQQFAPEREAVKDRLSQKFSLEFNYNSNHIEGNTLTYGQTEILLLFGKVVGEAKMFDLEEMKAHNVGLKMVLAEAKTDNPLTETFIRQIHQILLREDYEVYRNLPGGVTTSYTVHAGCYKTRPNSVITPSGERFEYASPEETPVLMADLIQWYQEEEAKAEMNPLELAALFHYRYIRIHPFEDGNGRIARLMMNFILARHKWPLIVVPTKTKRKYLEALGYADKKVGKVPSDGAKATLSKISSFVNYLEGLLVMEMQIDTAIAQSSESQWWYDGGWVSFSNLTIAAIVDLLIKDPAMSKASIAEHLGINPSAVQKHLKYLTGKGYMIRTGSNRNGKRHITLKKF